MEWVADSPGRLDSFLAEQEGSLSRAKIQKAIKSGAVRVDNKIVKKTAQALQEGQVVSLSDSAIQENADARVSPVDLSLEILHEDSTCLVVLKPSGIAVHPAPGIKDDEPTLLHGVAHVFKQKKILFSEDAVLVHRLDRETTGCILIAKTADAHHALQKQFENRTVNKAYLAIVAGVPKEPKALIDAPIGRNLTDRTRMSVMKTSVSREAQTSYAVLDNTHDCALLSCDLHTGRTHQIRVHLSSIGHPILGDPTYNTTASQKVSKEFKVANLALHSWKLGFVSPEDEKQKDIEAPLPDTFTDVLKSTELVLQ